MPTPPAPPPGGRRVPSLVAAGRPRRPCPKVAGPPLPDPAAVRLHTVPDSAPPYDDELAAGGQRQPGQHGSASRAGSQASGRAAGEAAAPAGLPAGRPHRAAGGAASRRCPASSPGCWSRRWPAPGRPGS